MMNTKLTPQHESYPIRPYHIDTSDHFFDAFGQWETENSARWIVQFCQERGHWLPFTYEDINDFYRQHGVNDGFFFNSLLGDFVEESPRGTFRVTDAFVRRLPFMGAATGGTQ